ncbi:endonuclease NucS domain-containing protein [Nonomuraea gerenzanensis]|uniref:endonuclease NucS domain-containing protein n=1 Tax=Nonomuraea gerenzanensis TaxID=93944 RepID=UPI001CD9DBEA|nr:endonuclease NucS domain-containing protein [Nonomuraea gerenzanensis]UBU16441.1 endonuclease NucS [Nonomuraea gerenzanensis]
MAATPHENRIRKFLAQRLHVLEPGLRRVDEEYILVNPLGAGGRIDILARDQHQMWVVIELKRSNQTAREATQEIAKYVELLRREKRLPADRIRAIVVALEPQWKELLAPLSNLERDWHHDLRGYSLRVDDEGIPLDARRIDLLPEPLDQKLTSIHFIYLFGHRESRDRCWSQVVRCAAEAHIDDLVGVDLDYCGPPGFVRNPYALYLGLGRVDPSKGLPPCESECDHETLDEEDRRNYDYPDEYDALCHLTSSVFGDEFETAGPGKFSDLVNHPHWKIGQIRAAGSFALGLYEADDLIAALRGNDGGARVLLHSSASTKIASRWAELRQAAMGCLATNDEWSEIVSGWFDAIGALPYEYDVKLHIYNPCDLIATLVFALPEGLREYRSEVITKSLTEYVPMVMAVARPRDGDGAHFVLRGMLHWNGVAVPDLRRRIGIVFRDPMSWHAVRAAGVCWQADRELLQILGMWYVAHASVFRPKPEGGLEELDNMILLPNELKPETVESWGGLFSLVDFIERHREETFLLVQEYRKGLHVVDTRNMPSSRDA